MAIRLEPDVEQALAGEASRRGTTPELLADEYLRQRFGLDSAQPRDLSGAKNLAERLKDHIGVIDSSEKVPGGACMSENSGQKFTEILIEKHRRNDSR